MSLMNPSFYENNYLMAQWWGWRLGTSPAKVVEQFLRSERGEERREPKPQQQKKKNGGLPMEEITGLKTYPTLPADKYKGGTIGEVEEESGVVAKVNDVSGETCPSSSECATYQDFNDIRSRCLAESRLFEDLKFPAVDRSLYYKEKLDRPITWLRPGEICKDPQLFVQGQSRYDVLQGDLGDCWLLIAVANLTLNKKLFFKVVPDDQNFDEGEYAGAFHFRLWQYGRWVEVVIDDRLPTHDGKLIFLHSPEKNEFWSALLEKAYAKLHGSYEALIGGDPCESMEDFTGGVAEIYGMTDIPPNFFTVLLKAYDRNSLIGCTINPDPDNKEAHTKVGLIRGHSYSVTKVKFVDIETPNKRGKIPFLRLRNPWGNYHEWNGPWSDNSPEWRYIPADEREQIELNFDADGEFWMSYQDFVRNLSSVQICNITLCTLDLEEYPKGKKWEMSVFDGQWIPGVTAGGCRNFLETFWRNPQYTVTLRDVDEDDDDKKCTIIIALMQKDRRSLGLRCLYIGFALYRLPDYGHVPKPLDINFFENNHPIRTSTTSLNFVDLREVTLRFKVEPGSYVIIPSTYEPDLEGEFILRVITEKSTDLV